MKDIIKFFTKNDLGKFLSFLIIVMLIVMLVMPYGMLMLILAFVVWYIVMNLKSIKKILKLK